MTVEEFEHKSEKRHNGWSTEYHWVDAYVADGKVFIYAITDANDPAELDKEAAIRLRDWLNTAIEVL